MNRSVSLIEADRRRRNDKRLLSSAPWKHRIRRPIRTASAAEAMVGLDVHRSDDALIGLIVQGDVDAFDVFYTRHLGLACMLASAIVRDDQLAEEIAQDAFLSLWRNRARYDCTRGPPTCWLRGIVRYRALDRLRGERCRPARGAAADARTMTLVAPDDVEAEILARERGRDVTAQVALLPVAQRDAIQLSFYGGLSHAEIASVLGLPDGTAKSRIRLGLDRLRVGMLIDSQ